MNLELTKKFKNLSREELITLCSLEAEKIEVPTIYILFKYALMTAENHISAEIKEMLVDTIIRNVKLAAADSEERIAHEKARSNLLQNLKNEFLSRNIKNHSN